MKGESWVELVRPRGGVPGDETDFSRARGRCQGGGRGLWGGREGVGAAKGGVGGARRIDSGAQRPLQLLWMACQRNAPSGTVSEEVTSRTLVYWRQETMTGKPIAAALLAAGLVAWSAPAKAGD